jgi:hypothetical protein
VILSCSDIPNPHQASLMCVGFWKQWGAWRGQGSLPPNAYLHWRATRIINNKVDDDNCYSYEGPTSELHHLEGWISACRFGDIAFLSSHWLWSCRVCLGFEPVSVHSWIEAPRLPVWMLDYASLVVSVLILLLVNWPAL